jgi:hypothetical protein
MTDDDEAEGAKAEAMARVERAADEAWKQAAYETVEKVARERPYLTADHVMENIPPDVHTHELRALGPVMLKAARNDVIEKAPVPAVNCTRANCHAAPLTVWHSLIWDGVVRVERGKGNG